MYFTLPSDRARRSASSAIRDDVPPMWKVRSVSCVPGSPMRLRRQDADRLAHVHHVHGGQVAAVAHPAEPARASQVSTERILTFSIPASSIALADFLVDQLAGLDQQRRVAVLVELVRIERRPRPATLPTMRSRSGSMMSSPSFSARDLETQDRAAILLGDRDVLRHVHQAARQVAGVGRLERRVGQTLPGAVRRDEVLEHREPFTEVRLDRALDDLADAAGELLLRLGHQAAHAGQLPDLVAASRASRSRTS